MTKTELLYGVDDEERLVGLHAEGDDKVRLYTRTEDDRVTSRTEDFHPYGHFTEDAADKLLEGYSPLRIDELSGSGAKSRMVVFETQKQFWSARGWLSNKVDREEYDLQPNLGSQYLQMSGKTLFGGMTMDDLLRMQVDIEVKSESGQFPNAERPGDEIIMVSITTNRGMELVIHQRPVGGSITGHEDYQSANYREVGDEARLLREIVKVVHRFDPDVLEFHNGFGFDLPYIWQRSEHHGVNFAIGRDSKTPRRFKSQKQFAERQQEYTNFLVAGRAVMDSYFMAADYDVFARDLPSYGLKALAKYFGFAAEDRTYVEGSKITQVWKDDPMRLIKYALDDVIETRKLVDKLGNSTFELAKILPTDYQDVLTLGTAGSIEILMRRTYIHAGEAIPTPEDPDPPKGGFTALFQRGVFKDLAYADVSSLYPSNMLLYGVSPHSDTLNIFRPLLQLLTDLRLKAKKKMRELPEGDERDTLDAKQSAFKVLINSFYGALAFAFFPWNDFEDSAKVTRKGRKLLKRLIHVIRKHGGNVVLCDTDGVMFELPREGMTDEEVDHLIGTEISNALPEGIEIDNDGRFSRVIAYKPKNYAKIPRGKGLDGMKIAGQALKGRGMEQFLRDYIKYQLRALASADVARMGTIHKAAKEAIMNGTMDVEQFQKRGRLKMTMKEYADSPSNLARYEMAKVWEKRNGKKAKAGDTIWYYVAGSNKKPTVYQESKLAEEYDNDENKFYLMDRLDNVADIFREMVDNPEQVFSMHQPNTDQSDLFDQETNWDAGGIIAKRVQDYPEDPTDEEIAPTHSLTG